MNFKRIIFCVLFIWSGLSWITGQEFNNQIVRAYKISNETLIDVFNKYGKIHVMTWEKDSVKFVIDIRIRNKDAAKLEKVKNNISFEFTPTTHYVIARTKFGDSPNDALKDLVDLAGSYFSSQNSITIDYTIMAPAFSTLKLENKFGDVYLDDREGNLNLTLSYGDFKANNLNGHSIIKLSSGDGEINSLQSGQINTSYSNLHVLNAQKLSLESRSSNITVDNVDVLTLRSKRDKLIIPKVRVMNGDSYFSEFSVLGLQDELNYIFRYGSLTVDNIAKNFSTINIQSEYTDIRLSFAKGAAYDIEITHHQDALLTYPRSMGTLEVKTLNDAEKQKLTYGRLGSAQSNSRVTISATKKCIISIIQK